jgi:hypothetical protein
VNTGILLVVVAMLWPSATSARHSALPQSSPPPGAAAGAPARHPGYDKLQMFVGDWTIEGRENTYVEKCDWFDGRFHMVCHTESKRSDGSVGRGISILGYLPEEDAYTYHGIGSRGRNETMRGTFEGSVFKAHGESRDGGKRVKSRVTIAPAANGDFTFRSESATDDGPWTIDGSILYKRMR